MSTYKNLFSLLRINQLLCCFVIIVAFCVSSEITRNFDPKMKLPDENYNVYYDPKKRGPSEKDEAKMKQNNEELYKMEKATVQKKRSASIFHPVKLLNNTDNYIRDDDLATRSTTKDATYFPFKVFIVAIAAALATFVLVIGYHLLLKIKRIQRTMHREFYLYGLLASFWCPMTMVVLYVVIIHWSENYIISQYYRPVNWLVGSLSCVCLLLFLLLDLVFVFNSFILALFNEGGKRNTATLEPLITAASG